MSSGCRDERIATLLHVDSGCSDVTLAKDDASDLCSERFPLPFEGPWFVS